jgi:hypothetical protein
MWPLTALLIVLGIAQLFEMNLLQQQVKISVVDAILRDAIAKSKRLGIATPPDLRDNLEN